MFTSTFLKDAFERAIKTFAQGYVATAAVLTHDIISLDSLKVAAAAAVISFVTSFASTQIGGSTDASLVK